MLVQLVCLDRRYQRMNCFNAREVDTIIKSKNASNSAPDTDIRFGVEETTIGSRYVG